MLESLFARFRPLRIVDPVFGSLQFQRAGFWEGHVAFTPTQSEVEVLIDGGPTGPTESQRHFFTELSSRFQAQLPALVEAMRDRRVSFQGPPRTAIPESFSLVCIGIPEHPEVSSSCELSFEDAVGFHYTVPIQGWAPGGVELKACLGVGTPNPSLQRTHRQSLRSFLFAAELDIVRRATHPLSTASFSRKQHALDPPVGFLLS